MRSQIGTTIGTSAAQLEPLEGRRLLSTVVGLTPDNALVRFDTKNPTAVSSRRAISGLSAGDSVVGIDYRAADLQLYGVVNGTTVDRIVRINPSNGRTTNVFNLTTELNGTEFGVDFNPVADALRITSDADQNLRVPFATGTTNVDAALNYGANDFNAGANPAVTASAYTNSFAGTTATVLYDIDADLDNLAIQNPPNAGTLQSRGPLGVNTGAMVGFDIQAASSNRNLNPGAAFVSLTRAGDPGSRLYGIDIATGGVRDVGAVGGTGSKAVTLRDITLVPAKGRGHSKARNDDRNDRNDNRDDRDNVKRGVRRSRWFERLRDVLDRARD